MSIKHPGILFVISAPSGGGKTTLVTHALKRFGTTHPLERVVTYTTRAPRRDEIAGKDYHFITKEEFLEKKAKNFFLETSEYDHGWYGSPSSILDDLENGHSRIIITDLNGVHSLHNAYEHAVCIWIEPPSIGALQQRLAKRDDLSPDQIKRRVALAQEEIHNHKHDTRRFSYRIVNDVLEVALEALCEILIDEMKKKATS